MLRSAEQALDPGARHDLALRVEDLSHDVRTRSPVTALISSYPRLPAQTRRARALKGLAVPRRLSAILGKQPVASHTAEDSTWSLLYNAGDLEAAEQA